MSSAERPQAQESRVHPRLSISAATTYESSFAEDIVAYRAAGSAGIGIWEYKLEGIDEGEARDLLMQSGLDATVCVPRVPSLYPDELFPRPLSPKERRAEMARCIRRLASYEPAACLFLANYGPDVDPREARRVVIEGLRAASEAAGEAGVMLALEPLRSELHTLAVYPSEGLELIDEAGVTNVTLLLDTWHFWDLPGIEEELADTADRVAAVQINGRASEPRSWCDRLLPGEGVIELAKFIAILEDAGYRSWYDVEIFSDNGQYGNKWPDSLWALSSVELASRSANAFRRTWEAARIASR